MEPMLDSVTAVSFFRRLVGCPEEEMDLFTAALSIALDEYPEMDLREYLTQIDRLSERARRKVGRTRRCRDGIDRLNAFLFGEEGFRGNIDDYYDPKNSFLNDVLDRRTGVPITLSIVYMEIGRRLGFPIQGVGLPGHFIIGVAGLDDVYVDPFNCGDILNRKACMDRVRKLFGVDEEDSPELIARASNRQILARVLNNLKAIYVRRECYEKALPVIDRLLIIDPEDHQEARDRALVLVRLKRFVEARTQLARFISNCPPGKEMEQEIKEAAHLMSWVQQVN